MPRRIQSGSSCPEDPPLIEPVCHKIERVATALDCSKSTVRRLIRDGNLHTINILGSVRVTDKSFIALLRFGTGKK